MNEENFKKSHNSIFADLFYGFQLSTMQCLSCQNLDTTYTIFNFLIFPLEKTYNSLNQINDSNMNNNMCYNMINNMNSYYSNNMGSRGNYQSSPFNMPTVIIPRSRKLTLKKNDDDIKRKLKLEDCFKENESQENLCGPNQIYCNSCHKYSDARTKSGIYTAPNVLILILNRGRGNYFKCDLDFPHKLDISKFVGNQESPKIYNLIGVISHLGESSMEGHFIAYCKHFDDNWYLFNDGIVTTVNETDIYKGTPYILFYQNKDIK